MPNIKNSPDLIGNTTGIGRVSGADRYSLRTLLYSSILTSGLLVVNVAAVAPAYAAACTGAADGLNSTACINGATVGDLTYVGSNGLYVGGNFDLLLFNHDVTGGIIFNGVSGDGTVTLASDSDVNNAAGDGINAFSSIFNGSVTIDVQDTSSVTGTGDGIDAVSTFSGNVTVTTAAGTTVSGTGGDGINADATFGGNVTVAALGTVTGSANGIDANASSGTVSVTTGAGAITGTTGDGIEATARSGNVTVITGTGAVTGNAGDGIFAQTSSGNVTVNAGGNVTGTGGDGIDASSTSSGNVTVTTAAGTTVTGTAGDGINAQGGTFGGNVTVTANSAVTGSVNGIDANANNGTVSVTTGTATVAGTAGDGIQATASDNVTVTANGSVSGGVNGISAVSSFGGGFTGGAATVIATDNSVGGQTISGGTGDGIMATGGFGNIFGGAATVSVTDNSTFGTTVSGGVNGISATGGDAGSTFSGGDAAVTITDNSTFGTTVTGGTGDGIVATGGNSASGGNGTVTITDNSTFGTTVTGGANGITATGGNGSTFGGGDATVTITANSTFGTTVTGGVNGIVATGGTGGSGAATVSVTGNSTVIGTTGAGILAAGGTGGGNVTVSILDATVQGLTSGINASSTTGSIITINISNIGQVQNLSGNDADLAILTAGGNTTINTSSFASTITGRIVTGVGNDTLNNGGTWITEGTSDFGAGTDAVNNTLTGTIFAGNDAGVADTTSFVGLEALNNSGFITLSDQGFGDGSNISDTLSTDGDYNGIGGGLGVDAFLGAPGSVADVLLVGGNTSGVTSVFVNDTNAGPGAFNPDGILVVDVAGASSAGDFVLASGPIDKGMFFYDLLFDPVAGTHALYGLPDQEVFETLAAVSGAQAVWKEGASMWAERQDVLRDIVAGRVVVTGVADVGLPEDQNDNTFWLAVRNTWLDRDAGQEFSLLNQTYAFNTSYGQDILSIYGGADFGTNLGGDGTLLFGVMAGYVSSSLDFDTSNTSIDMDGFSGGLYAAYLNSGFFFNVLAKADLLDMDYDVPSAGSSDSASVTNLGVRADAGFRMDAGSAFFEPLVSFMASSTSIDDYEIGGATVDSGTNESLLLGAGVRMGLSTEMVTMSVTGRVWNEFGDDNTVNITAGAPLEIADAGLDGLYGEIAGMVSLDVATDTTLFAGGSYRFSDNTDALSVKGGLTYSW